MDQKIIKFGDWVLNGYKDSKNAKPLCTLLPRLSAYRINFDETKYL